MPLSLEQFAAAVAECGLASPEELGVARAELPEEQRGDVNSLARALVAGGKLTKYQAMQVYQGQAKSLVLGQYLVLEKIGAGGMGQVFKARHRVMGRIVALKLLPAEGLASPEVIKRFQREVRAAARLNHPHIVAAYDADQADGVHYLVMEYVEGQDLDSIVKQQGRLPVNQALDYTIQAAKGLAYAHAQGIVHRDIKPHNLMLCRQELRDESRESRVESFGLTPAPHSQLSTLNSQLVKILDMGLARVDLAGGKSETEGLTQSGVIMGTVDYMSPEQAEDTRRADHRADIYSLGCTLFRLLTGHTPFAGQTVMQKLVAHRERPIPLVCQERDDCPAAVDAVLARMLAKEPEQRFQTMNQCLAALTACRTGAPLPAGVSVATPGSDQQLADFFAGLTGPAVPISNLTTNQLPANRQNENLPQGMQATQVLAASNSTDTAAMPAQPGGNARWIMAIGRQPALWGGGMACVLALITIAVLIWQRNSTPLAEGTGKNPSAAKTDVNEGKTPGANAPVEVLDGAWVKRVQALPATEQVKAVVNALKQRNENFDGVVQPTLNGDQVYALKFSTDAVTDLSALQALPGLEELTCQGTGAGKGQLADLSPLAGMKLTKLVCGNNSKISDFSPLAGMPLRWLSCTGAAVDDLSPLAGMPLEYLSLYLARMTDLSPLAGMPLTYLNCRLSAVGDLRPLAGMKLAQLHCGPPGAPDLSPLAGMPLKEVYIEPLSPWRDVTALKAMPTLEKVNGKPAAEFWVEFDAKRAACDAWAEPVMAMPAQEQGQAVIARCLELNPKCLEGHITFKVQGRKVTILTWRTGEAVDLSPLRALPHLGTLALLPNSKLISKLADLSPLVGLPLHTLDVHHSRVSDLSPLHGMPLESLTCYSTSVADLSPLAGMQLKVLHLATTPVSDLEPLRGMPLEQLLLEQSHVSDLRPLQGMPLKHLKIEATPVADLSPLAGMPLESLFIARTRVNDTSPLAGLPLKEISLDFSFWRDAEVLRSISTLETINRKRAGEFFMLVDAQHAAFDAWAQQVAAMSPEEQVQAVGAEIKRRNPGFDGALTPVITGDAVTSLSLVSDHVADLAPLRALSQLKTLHCTGSGPRLGRVTDLWPLRGLPLIELHLTGNQVADLVPLKGIKLSTLQCNDTNVTDLTPLAAVPLVDLVCDFQPARDTAALKQIETLQTINGQPAQEVLVKDP